MRLISAGSLVRAQSGPAPKAFGAATPVFCGLTTANPETTEVRLNPDPRWRGCKDGESPHHQPPEIRCSFPLPIFRFFGSSPRSSIVTPPRGRRRSRLRCREQTQFAREQTPGDTRLMQRKPQPGEKCSGQWLFCSIQLTFHPDFAREGRPKSRTRSDDQFFGARNELR